MFIVLLLRFGLIVYLYLVKAQLLCTERIDVTYGERTEIFGNNTEFTKRCQSGEECSTNFIVSSTQGTWHPPVKHSSSYKGSYQIVTRGCSHPKNCFLTCGLANTTLKGLVEHCNTSCCSTDQCNFGKC